MLNRLKRLLSSVTSSSSNTGSCRTLTPAQHKIDFAHISSNALNVIKVLQGAGYSAYLVGGCVRDLLLGGTPKDFDVATSATPEQVKRLFRSALIIGRRFRIVHVRFGREVIEVTTFRGHHSTSNGSRDAEQSESGLLLRDNVFGDIQSDAIRRDFTVNALYLEPTSGSLLDFTSGFEDLDQRVLRMIGEPQSRYREDPVRMLRAVRFAAKLGFKLDRHTEAPIRELAPLLGEVPPARLFEEVLKLMLSGSATASLELLEQMGLLTYLFPGTSHCLQKGPEFYREFVGQVVTNTDKRIRQDKKVTPAFIYAAFLWPPLQTAAEQLQNEQGMTASQAMNQAAQGVISQQLSCTAIPKRFLIPLREIWLLQHRLLVRDGRRSLELLEHPRFRAAYDFLLLRESSGEDLGGLGNWWTRLQEASETERQRLLEELGQQKRKRRPRRRKRKPGPNPESDGSPQE